MKNLKEMLLNLKGESNLKDAVIDIAIDHIGEYDEAEGYFNNVLDYGCASGVVGELIYYTQTTEFFNTHADEIFDLYNELKSEYGEIDIELSKNNLSWLAFEETLRQIANDLNMEA